MVGRNPFKKLTGTIVRIGGAVITVAIGTGMVGVVAVGGIAVTAGMATAGAAMVIGTAAVGDTAIGIGVEATKEFAANETIPDDPARTFTEWQNSPGCSERRSCLNLKPVEIETAIPTELYRLSRQSPIASPAVTMKATALTHMGMVIPLTVTSQPSQSRSACARAIKIRRTTVTVVKGFMLSLRR